MIVTLENGHSNNKSHYIQACILCCNGALNSYYLHKRSSAPQATKASSSSGANHHHATATNSTLTNLPKMTIATDSFPPHLPPHLVACYWAIAAAWIGFALDSSLHQFCDCHQLPLVLKHSSGQLCEPHHLLKATSVNPALCKCWVAILQATPTATSCCEP